MTRLRKTGAAILIAGFAVLIYALAVEPFWLEITRHEVDAPVDRPLKIAVVADLHTRKFGRLEKKVLKAIHQEKPDIIMIPGDLIGGSGYYKPVGEFLQNLSAPEGVWVARGNWEVWRPGARTPVDAWDSPAVFLVNRSTQIRPGVWLAGLDDPWAGRPLIHETFAPIPKDAFVIALFHSPEYFDAVAMHCSLAITGHTHGGQICWPGGKPLWLPGGCGPYVKGWYERGGARMHVSRGIGTSILPLRFASRPELAFITLVPARQN